MKPVKDIASSAKHRASDLASRATGSAAETAAAARARIASTYGQAKAGTLEMAAQGRDHLSHLTDQAGDIVEKGRGKARVAGAKAKTHVERHPLTAVAGALAVGAVIGLLLPKARRDASPDDPA